MNSLTVIPAATGLRQMNSSCAKLILTAEIECAAFISAAKQLFGEEVALHAGGFWVDALEAESSFRCQASGLRPVTILAAGRLADQMGATAADARRYGGGASRLEPCRASAAVALNVYIVYKPETLERGSKFCGALRELSAECDGEVRRASESAAQGDIKNGFVRIAEHRFRSLHS